MSVKFLTNKSHWTLFHFFHPSAEKHNEWICKMHLLSIVQRGVPPEIMTFLSDSVKPLLLYRSARRVKAQEMNVNDLLSVCIHKWKDWHNEWIKLIVSQGDKPLNHLFVPCPQPDAEECQSKELTDGERRERQQSKLFFALTATCSHHTSTEEKPQREFPGSDPVT